MDAEGKLGQAGSSQSTGEGAGTAAAVADLRARLGVRHGHEKQIEAWRRAARITPRGVQSNYRYWGDDETPVMARGRGAHIWDVDGNEYVDYRSGYGAVFLGHGFEPVCDAVNRAVRDGCVFTLSTPWETRVAEKIQSLCPNLEMLRFCNSGTEATMHAIRVARAFTGRDKVLKFEGNFHGVHDYTLWSTAGATPDKLGSRENPTAQQMSRGIPKVMRELILAIPYNDEALLEAAFKAHGHELAAAIAEPVMGNAASVQPSASWFALLRRLCTEHGVAFILDEVKTGFRIAPGGAQEVWGLKPDLATYAKALGNGFPIGMFGGRRDMMDLIGPGGVTHGGTFNGNVAAMAAAEAVVDLIADGRIHAEVGRLGERLSHGISALLTRFEVPHLLCGPPQMWGLLLTDAPARDFREVYGTRRALYTQIMMGLIERGAFPEPDVREPWFMNYGHSDADIDFTLSIFEDVLKSIPAEELRG
jgi:glutamate-1-semialdehyde 2,1-aminomutase